MERLKSAAINVKAFFNNQALKTYSNTPQKQNQDFVKEHNRTVETYSRDSGKICEWEKIYLCVSTVHNSTKRNIILEQPQ